MNNNKNKLTFNTVSNQRGQSIFLALGLALVLSVTLFLVFNSGRAVNEKINLVNAADAAAYSGAQIAARQLNFMAYTNRAMIANEVAIGHMFSYQMEVDIVTQSLGAIFGSIPWIGSFLESFLSPILDGAAQLSRVITGLYSIAVDSNNALYSSLQYEAFKDFAYPDDGVPLIEAAMRSVLRDYQIRPTAPILLNDSNVLTYFALNGEGTVQSSAVDAGDMNSDFCKMLLFVKPGVDASGNTGDSNQMESFCQGLADGESSVSGSPNSPVSDDGAMLSMLQSTVSNFGNAEWIRNRDSNYRFLGFRIQRRGSTTVTYDSAADQLNWESESDTLRVGDPLFNIQIGSIIRTDGNAGQLSEDAADAVSEQAIEVLRQAGVCGDEDEDGETLACDSLLNGRYGSIKRYAYLNPSAGNPVVTAFLSQSNCSDNIGVNDEGEKIDNWHDNVGYLDRYREICDKTVYAVSQATVYFQRPPCAGTNCQYGFSNEDASGLEFQEQANLFNPFWQVRLLASDGD